MQTRRTENRPLFDLLLNALKWLSEDESDPVNLARYFELHLLQHVGYRPRRFVSKRSLEHDTIVRVTLVVIIA